MNVHSAFSVRARSGRPGTFLVWSMAWSLLCACSPRSPGKSTSAEEHSFTIIALAELRGTIEPCGCNSDPLGDIARTTEIVTSLRAQGKPVLVVDGGSLLYTQPDVPEHLLAQETLRSELIYNIYQNDLNVAAIGLGPYDFGTGKQGVRPARQAANVSPDSGVPIEPPKVVDVGQVKVGIFGVVAPSALSAFGITASDPTEAARAAVADLRKRGAQVIVGLAHMTDTDSKVLAREVKGIDFLVAAYNVPIDPDDVKMAPSHVGDTYVVIPANRGQVVTRLDVTVRTGQDGPLTDALGQSRAEVELASLAERIKELDADVARWKSDAAADPAFVATKERELAELRAREQTLSRSPVQIPATGSYFTMTQVRIAKGLPCHVAVQKAKQAYDREAGAANVAAAAGKQPPPPAPGQASYAGVEACADCHDEQVAFWKKTHHNRAWETLETLGKQFDYECISCHVTGWDKPGGSNLAVNETLRDVQCEQCHGPGSLHIDGDGDPDKIIKAPAEDTCKGCHNSEHSDTFEFAAYLRDVTGEGHGAEFREQLGAGKTGHELRSAALAGKVKGANCIK